MSETPQSIRDHVADFICPIDSIANYQQGYRRHEAEQIRAGRGDEHELVRLVMRCVAPVADDDVIQADREAADSISGCLHMLESLPMVTQAFARHRQQHAPPSPSGYERGLEDAAKVARAVFDANPGDNDSASGSRAAAAGIEAALLTLKDPAR